MWEKIARENLFIDIGSDQTSLHNPWSGGYYPVGLSFEDSKIMMAEEPEKFKVAVQESLLRHAAAINTIAKRGMYFLIMEMLFFLKHRELVRIF